MIFGQHALHGLLGDQKGTEGADLDGAFDVVGGEVDQRPPHPVAGVVDDDVGRPAGGIERPSNSAPTAAALLASATQRHCAGLGGDRLERLAPARRDRDPHAALPREGAREAGAKAGAGADDQRASVRSGGHAAPCATRRAFCGNIAFFASSSMSVL